MLTKILWFCCPGTVSRKPTSRLRYLRPFDLLAVFNWTAERRTLSSFGFANEECFSQTHESSSLHRRGGEECAGRQREWRRISMHEIFGRRESVVAGELESGGKIF